MSQNWGGGGGGGSGWGGGGYGPPGGGSGTTPGAPPGAGGYGPPPGGFGAGGGGFAPPPPGYPPGYTPGAAGGAVPWEDKSRGFFGRWWDTAKAVNFDARKLFAGAAQSDDPWPSITFGVTTGGIVGLVFGILVAVLYIAMGSFFAAMLSGAGAGGRGGPPPAAMGAIMGIAGVAAAVIYPIYFMFIAFVGPWISGGLTHGMLALMKCATKPYMSTVRVTAYSHGAWLWYMVPGVGGLVGLVFQCIATIVGVDETHKCGTGKAAAAVLIPLAVVFCCCCGAYVGLIGLSASTGHHR